MSGNGSESIFPAPPTAVRKLEATVDEYSLWLHRRAVKSKAMWESVMKGFGYTLNIDPRACFEKYPSTAF
jgi:hypothetical protein